MPRGPSGAADAATRDDGGATPVRLVDAAEALIAEHGVDAVSLRAVNVAAAANVAACHYHFGSKEALVTAVLERRMQRLAAERYALLDDLERQRRPEPRAAAAAFVLPFVRLLEDEEGRRYARFLAALDRAGPPWWDLVAAGFAPQWERFEPVLRRTFPRMPDAVLRFRLSVVSASLLGPLAAPREPLTGPLAELSGTGLEHAVVDVVVGILTAPVTTPPRTTPRTKRSTE